MTRAVRPRREQEMSEWRPMNTAPKDEETILITVATGEEFPVKFDSTAVGSWVATTDEYPDCWTGGVCWETNEYYRASMLPIAWRPIEKE